MTIKWNTPAGQISELIERIRPVDLYVEALSTDNLPIEFSIISGNLPRGLSIGETIKVGSAYRVYIVGSPVEVRKITSSRFVIRANDGIDLEDRTFSINVVGYDAPEWITDEGFLPVGINGTEYVLDNTFLNIQLEAYDTDAIAGDTLTYFLVPNAGQLPPGISLTESGLISGIVDPIMALEFNDDIDGFDVWNFDLIPFDFVQGYGYDDDPKRLSRIYSFVVGVTDGVNIVNRLFKIFVVTDEFLKNNQVIDPSDLDYRRPIWITPQDLGRYRANNYITIFLEVYDPASLKGVMGYHLLPTNHELEVTIITPTDAGINIVDISSPNAPSIGQYVELEIPYRIIDVDLLGTNQYRLTLNAPLNYNLEDNQKIYVGSLSQVPPNLSIDSLTGKLAGISPYQARVSKTYDFTVMAVNFPINELQSFNFKGLWMPGITYVANDIVFYNGSAYFYNAEATDPSITNTDSWTRLTSLTNRTFNLTMVGEIESAIEWITDSDLGSIRSNQSSMISLEAVNLLNGGNIVYKLISGELPPGLSLISSGDIIGKVIEKPVDILYRGYWVSEREYQINDVVEYEGLYYIAIDVNSSSTFDELFWQEFDLDAAQQGMTGFNNVSFDSNNTTFDHTYTFTVVAKDTINFSEVTRTFTLNVEIPTTASYCDLYVKGFLSKDRRILWSNFISDSTIFQYDDIYRYGDKNFGVQNELKVLIFAGIENVDAVKYIQSMSRNHYRKRLLFGDIKSAKAKDPVTQETLYEVVYIDIVDEYEKNGRSISQVIELSDTIESKVLVSYNAVTVDSDIPFVSDSDHQRIFPNSIKNMRKRMNLAGDRDRTFLPLWMRSIQDVGRYEPGYTKALILCYTKPERAAITISRIKASGFDFKTLDFVADRYLIDMPEGENGDKYLAFPQRGEKRP